jgi:hypothetical protein
MLNSTLGQWLRKQKYDYIILKVVHSIA